MALNTAIATQLTLLPPASPASGFTYQYDPASGVYTRSAESFGPVMTERAETIGRHRFYFGGTFQRTSGLTNKIDLSVDIPFVQVGYNVNSEATINRIVNTEPIFTPGPNGVNVECCASSGGAGPYGPTGDTISIRIISEAVFSADLRNGQSSPDLLNPARTGDIYWNPSKAAPRGFEM